MGVLDPYLVVAVILLVLTPLLHGLLPGSNKVTRWVAWLAVNRRAMKSQSAVLGSCWHVRLHVQVGDGGWCLLAGAVWLSPLAK